MISQTPTNYAEMKFYLDFVVLIGVVGNTGYTWWSNREKVTSQRFAALEKEVAERLKRSDIEQDKQQQDKRCLLHQQDIKEYEQGSIARLNENEKKVERIGAEIRNLPQHRHIEQLSVRVEQVHGGVEKCVGRLDGLSRAVDLMNQFLIEQGGKR